tara:strand:+ start:217 stop:447 length:231 start_codon:yes stop_codon:yes gene_type:complete
MAPADFKIEKKLGLIFLGHQEAVGNGHLAKGYKGTDFAGANKTTGHDVISGLSLLSYLDPKVTLGVIDIKSTGVPD